MVLTFKICGKGQIFLLLLVRQGFSVLCWRRPGWPWAQIPSCFCLRSPGIKGVSNHAWSLERIGFFFSVFIYLLCVHEYFFHVRICSPCMPVGSPEMGYRWLWAHMWVLGIKPRFFAGTISALNHLTISPASGQIFKCWYCLISSVKIFFCSWLILYTKQGSDIHMNVPIDL